VPAGFLGSCADLRMRETGPGPGEKRLPVLRRREALVIRSVDRGRRKLISYAKRVTTFGPQNAVIMVTGFA